MAVAHEAGVAHGRLVPENVLVDRAGSVRVIGFSVDAALHGLPPGRIATDVADLGGLLYAALTGKWPGVSRSKVPPAPDEHGRVLRPRQVRAGIPRPLDVLCDEVVNPYAGSHPRQGHDLGTARGIGDYLSQFVGDPTGMAEAEAAVVAASQRGDSTVVMPRLARRPTRAANPGRAPEAEDEIDTDPDTQPETEPDTEPDADTDTAPETEPDAPPGADRVPAEQPTQAGLPIFDDITDDVSWLARRPTPPPPPPPFEEPPERPLFAPAPVAGQPARRPRPQSATSTGGSGYWPWDTGGDPGDTGGGAGTGTAAPVTDDEDDEVPGRQLAAAGRRDRRQPGPAAGRRGRLQPRPRPHPAGGRARTRCRPHPDPGAVGGSRADQRRHRPRLRPGGRSSGGEPRAGAAGRRR